jgi:hypothetical protein
VPETHAYNTGKLTPQGEKAWAAYCKTAGRAYAQHNPESKHHVYQITWEPLPPWGFKGSDADLIRIYEIAYPALHEADPYAIVAGPCRGLWNNGDPDATFRLLKLGLAKYLDGYTAHPYYTETPEADGMAQSIRKMKEVLRTTTGKDLPMYGTEQGLATDEDISKELMVAHSLMRQNLITIGEGFVANLAFTYYDYRMGGSRTGYGYNYNLIDSVPFGPGKVGPKAISAAYAAQSMLLEGSKSLGAIEWLGKDTWGYAFERPEGVTLALWNYTHTTSVTIPTGAREVHVYDWMGNEHPEQTVGGALKVNLEQGEPVYVSGVSPNVWGSAAANLLAVKTKELKAYPEDNITLTGKALLPADKSFEGTLTLDDPAGKLPTLSRQVRLGGKQPTPFEFNIKIPTDLRLGTHALRMRLADAAGQTLTVSSLTLDVVPPAAGHMQSAFDANGKPALEVRLQEKRGRAMSGKVAVSIKEFLPGQERSDAPDIDLVVDPGKTRDVPQTNKEVALNLAPNGNQHLVIDFPGAALVPTKRYQALVTVTSANGSSFSETTPVYFLGASHLAEAPTIDGDLSDWQGDAGVFLTAKDVVRSAQWCPAGLSAKFRYAWDERALYIAAEVNDDVFVQMKTGADTWSQDCLQLAFNLDPNPETAKGGERRNSEINVALTPNGPEAYRSYSFALDKLPSCKLTSEQLSVVIKKAGAGKLTYEMAIPWATLGMGPGEKPKVGDAIGVAATVNEVRNEQQGDPSALGLFGGIIPDKNPDKNGILTLK